MNAGALVFQSFGKALQILENGVETGCREDADRILGVFVEVGVEDAHVHEVGFALDVEKDPAEVMQLQHGEDVRLTGHGLLDVLGVLIEDLLPSGDDLRDDGEAVARRGLGKDRAVSALLYVVLGEPPLGIAIAAGLVQSCCFVVSDIAVPFLFYGLQAPWHVNFKICSPKCLTRELLNHFYEL